LLNRALLIFILFQKRGKQFKRGKELFGEGSDESWRLDHLLLKVSTDFSGLDLVRKLTREQLNEKLSWTTQRQCLAHQVDVDVIRYCFVDF